MENSSYNVVVIFSGCPQFLGDSGMREFPESTTDTSVPLAHPCYTVIFLSLQTLSTSSSNAINEQVNGVSYTSYKNRETTMGHIPYTISISLTPTDPIFPTSGLQGWRELGTSSVFKTSGSSLL